MEGQQAVNEDVLRGLFARMEYAKASEARLAVRVETFAVRLTLVSRSCWNVVRSVVAALARLLR